MLDTLQGWADHLTSLAAPVVRETPVARQVPEHEAAAWIGGFRDERGHRRVIDRPLLAWVLGLPEEAVRGGRSAQRGDVRLWECLATGDHSLPEIGPAGGPLFPDLMREGIELWTEAELAGTHALWNLAQRSGLRDLSHRVDAALTWLIRELQPDNATNHPWAIQAFIERGARGEDHDARLYAETLLHNAIIELGRPERFSAVILWDAAAGLREIGR